MSQDKKLPIDVPVAGRMGLQGCVAAVLLDDDELNREVAIQQPGFLPSGESWALIEHFDCDPENDTAGSSGVASFDTFEEAVAEFRTVISGYDRKVPGFVVAGLDTRGAPVFLSVDTMGSGYPFFTDSRELAEWYPKASSAANALARVGKVPTDRAVDAASFGVVNSPYLTRSVSPEADGGEAPAGWSFVVGSADSASFKMPERHWMDWGNIGEASKYRDLVDARSAATGAGDIVLMVSRRVGASHLTSDELQKLLSYEEWAMGGEPEITPRAGAPYTPR